MNEDGVFYVFVRCIPNFGTLDYQDSTYKGSGCKGRQDQLESSC